MSNHQQITIVRDTAETNGEVDAVEQEMTQAEAPAAAEAPKVESQPQRPEWLPEKFQKPEDMALAYAELEKKFSSKPVNMGSLDEFSKEFQTNGDLSAESIKKISEMGIPEQIVKAYIDGQKAVLDANVSSVFGLAGGEERYKEIIGWAGEHLPSDEIDTFNSVLDSGNMNAIRMAVQGVKARYEQANGSVGRLIQGETSGPSGGAFRSIAEIVEAMRDPRYAKDPAYRKDVEQRVAISNALGVSR